MNSKLIYIKTKKGEQVVFNRLREMPRHQRMVLILVDGQSTVPDLILKTGDVAQTERALFELQMAELITPLTPEHSMWTESQRIAMDVEDEVKKQSKAPPLPELNVPVIASGFQFKKEEKPFDPKSIAANSILDNEDVPSQWVSNRNYLLNSAFKEEPRTKSVTGRSTQGEKKPAQAPAESNSQPVETKRASQEPKVELKIQPTETGERQKLNAEIPYIFEKRSDADPIKPDEAADDVTKEIRSRLKNRGTQKKADKMGWFGKSSLILLSLIVLATLTILYFPYNRYTSEAQDSLAGLLGVPVKVGTMDIQFYPAPGITLNGVVVGKNDQKITISKIRMLPVLSSMLGEKLVLRKLVLSGIDLSINQIEAFSKHLASAAAASSNIALNSVFLEKTSIGVGKLSVPGLEGELLISAQGFGQMILSSHDKKSELEINRKNNQLEITLDTFDWYPFEKAATPFQSANITAIYQNNTLTINTMDLRIYGGMIEGKLAVEDNNAVTMQGEISFKRLDSMQLGNTLGIGPLLSGEISGDLSFSTNSPDPVEAFANTSAQGEFAMGKGSIRGIDLPEAMRRTTATPVHGGATTFESFSGKLSFQPGNYQLSNIALNSGLMLASGRAQINQDQAIIAPLLLQLRGTINRRELNVTVTGRLDKPLVQFSN